MSKKEVYDVLTVEGDCYPVPRKVTDWLQAYPDDLGAELSIVEDFPDFITELFDQDEVQAVMEDHDPQYSASIPGKQSHTTCGSWENDRVLHMVPFLMCFEDMGDVREWLKENNFKLGSKLEYYSY